MWDMILDVIADALLDTLKLAPLLIVVHVLIEVLEYHAASKVKLNKALSGRLAPLVGSAAGIIPQCGFSVVATNLYARRSIALGTLISVYIATSDEAIPILLSNFSAAHKLLPLLLLKLVFAVAAGYLVNFFVRKQKLTALVGTVTAEVGCHGHKIGEHTHDDVRENSAHAHGDESAQLAHAQSAEQGCANESAACQSADGTRHAKKKFDWQCFVVHPLVHTLTVLGFILAVNLALGLIIGFVGQQRLADFLQSGKYAQPFLAALVGLMPNCASSVVLTQLYASSTIGLGAAFAGLSVNAGLGLAVLLRVNKPMRQNLMIIGGMYVFSSVIGVLITFIVGLL